MVEVVVVIIILLLLIILLNFRIYKINGGYIIPTSFTKQSPKAKIHDKDSALNEYKILKDGEMDKFCKCICYYFFSKYGVSPTRMPYVGGSSLANIKDMKPYIRLRYIPSSIKTFIPDFVISYNMKLLILEFDENNSYHQTDTDKGYVMKNYIYDEILCNERNHNVCILRIKYNRSVTDATKPMAMRIIVSLILFTYVHMKKIFKYCYLLAALDITDKTVRLSEFVAVKAASEDIMKTFTPTTPLFSCFNLDSRELLPAFASIRKNDDIKEENMLPMFKKELFDEYKDSHYERYFNRKIIDDNSIDQVIKRFDSMTLII